MQVINKIKEIITNYTEKPKYLSTSKVELQLLSNSLVHTDWDFVLALEVSKVIIMAKSKQTKGYVRWISVTLRGQVTVLSDCRCSGCEETTEELLSIIVLWLKEDKNKV